MANLFATKSLSTLMQESQETGEHSLKRTLGPVNLILLGIGAIIGAGLFVRTAAAIADRSDLRSHYRLLWQALVAPLPAFAMPSSLR